MELPRVYFDVPCIWTTTKRALVAFKKKNNSPTAGPRELQRLKIAIDFKQGTMSPNRDTPTPKKRESRAGTRKVTSLSAEQLERKRANDREAQRTIRERTKKHIDNLEQQVAELRAKGEHYDDVVRRNAALQDEIKRLRHELAIISGRQGGYSDPHRKLSLCYFFFFFVFSVLLFFF